MMANKPFISLIISEHFSTSKVKHSPSHEPFKAFTFSISSLENFNDSISFSFHSFPPFDASEIIMHPIHEPSVLDL